MDESEKQKTSKLPATANLKYLAYVLYVHTYSTSEKRQTRRVRMCLLLMHGNSEFGIWHSAGLPADHSEMDKKNTKKRKKAKKILDESVWEKPCSYLRSFSQSKCET